MMNNTTTVINAQTLTNDTIPMNTRSNSKYAFPCARGRRVGERVGETTEGAPVLRFNVGNNVGYKGPDAYAN